jgi:hypothetical protein
MSPQILDSQASWTSPVVSAEEYAYDGPPRNVAYIEALDFPKELQPKNYEIAGTHPDSKILFLDVKILEATGRLPYQGDVLIKGEEENPKRCSVR